MADRADGWGMPAVRRSVSGNVPNLAVPFRPNGRRTACCCMLLHVVDDWARLRKSRGFDVFAGDSLFSRAEVGSIPIKSEDFDEQILQTAAWFFDPRECCKPMGALEIHSASKPAKRCQKVFSKLSFGYRVWSDDVMLTNRRRSVFIDWGTANAAPCVMLSIC